jgi:hypothetical protein
MAGWGFPYTYIMLLHISWSNNEKTSSWVMFLDKNMQNEVSSYKYGKSAKPCLSSREKKIFIKSSIAKDTPSYLYEDFISYKLHMWNISFYDFSSYFFFIFTSYFSSYFFFIFFLHIFSSYFFFIFIWILSSYFLNSEPFWLHIFSSYFFMKKYRQVWAVGDRSFLLYSAR